MNLFTALFAAGLERGSAYALVAVGFTVIYSSTKVINFSQGQFLMFGAMFAFAFTAAGLPLGLALPMAILAGGLLGLLLERMLITPLENRGAPKINTIIATLAFGVVAEQGMGLGVSRNPQAVPSVFTGPTVVLGPLRISQQGLLLLVVTAAIAGALWWVFQKTDMGIAIRAIGYNNEGARVLGLNVPFLIATTVMVSGAIAAIAGGLVAGTTGASAYMGLAFGVKGFSGAVLGGLGNPLAGVLGGLLIGLIESFGQYYLPHGYGSVLPYFVLIAMLLFRPSGIFPEAE